MSRPEYEVVVADTPELVQACYDIRIEGRSSLPPPPSAFAHPSSAAVFVAEQGFSIDDEMDHYDQENGTVHMLLNVLERGEEEKVKRVPVGVVRIITSKNKVRRACFLLLSRRLDLTRCGAQLGRLAILRDYRSYGFGKVLVQGVHDWARAQLKGPDESVQVVLHAQVRRYSFPLVSFGLVGS